MVTEHATGVVVNESDRKIAGPPGPSPAADGVVPAKKKAATAKPKAALATKTRKSARWPSQPSRATSKTEKLVCGPQTKPSSARTEVRR